MKLTVRKKLIGGFFSIAIIFGIINGIYYFYLKKVDASYSDLVNRRGHILTLAKDIQYDLSQEEKFLHGYLLLPGNIDLQGFQQAHDKVNQDVTKTLKLIEQDADIQKLKKIEELNDEYKKISQQVIEKLKTNRIEAIDLLNTNAGEMIQEMESQAFLIANHQQESMDDGAIENTTLVKSIMNIIFLTCFIGFILAILLGYLISISISKPIIYMAKESNRIASGDLTIKEIEVTNRDEIRDLARSFNQMAKSLRELIVEINSNAEHVAFTAEELAASTEQSGRVTEQIAASIQELASGSESQTLGAEDGSVALNEITRGILQLSENATIVSEASRHTMKQAEEGGESIEKTLGQMTFIHQSVSKTDTTIQSLHERSEKITEILNVIVSIARQTNLLALNAAIEAARAGENGRGFAVVADEVRKLADESNTSAQQITKIIEEIQKDAQLSVQAMNQMKNEVQVGMDLAQTAEEKFNRILGSMKQITQQIQMMSSTSQQISAGSQQVASSVSEMAQIAKEVSFNTQHVAASTEEQLVSMEKVSSSSLSLSKMAEELQKLVGKFRI